MKRLHTFILKSFAGPLVLTFFIVAFVLLMQFLFRYIDELVGKGLETIIIIEFLYYSFLTLIPMALPLSVLLASIMTFGNLGEHFELTAIKSAGISLQKIMRPLMITAVLISLAAFFFANYTLPHANLKLYSLIHDMRKQRPELNIVPGIFDNSIEDMSFRVNGKNNDTKLLEEILIYDHREKNGNTDVTYADSGYMEMSAGGDYLIFKLYSGYTYREMQNPREARRKWTHPHRKHSFAEQVIMFPIDNSFSRTDENAYSDSYYMKTIGQLQNDADSLTKVKNKRVERFIRSMRGNIFSNDYITRKIERDSNYVDSVPQLKSFVVDTLVNHLDDKEIMRVYDLAVANAKGARNTIGSSIGDLSWRAKRIRRHDIEWHRKFTLSAACLIFFFIGAPLGAIIRKGGLGTPVIISTLFFIIYYIVSISANKMVREGFVPAVIGVWFSSFMLIPVGAFLTYQATTDSVIMNSETYVKFFQKIASFFPKRKKKEQTKA